MTWYFTSWSGNIQWWKRGYCRHGPNIYVGPHLCSRNTFAAQNCHPCKGATQGGCTSHTPFAPPLETFISHTGYDVLFCRKELTCTVHFGLIPSVVGNVLFNDALNTFYLRLYGVRHMVKDHSDREIGNPLLPHVLLFSINSKVFFICTIPQTE